MSDQPNVHSNAHTPFTPKIAQPVVDPAAFIHSHAVVMGHVHIGPNVFVGPFASIRGDEGIPIHIAHDANVQDAVVIHAFETAHNGQPIHANLRCVDGQHYAVYIGPRVSLGHQSQIHGPAVVHHDTFVGMQALVFRATIGHHCVIEPAAKIMNVTIPPNRYVPAATVISDQHHADNLPHITPDYPYHHLNASVVNVNTALAAAYNQNPRPKPTS